MMDTYRLVVGEQGNEQGHIIPTRARTQAGAQRALAAALRPYDGDGWGHIEYQHDNGEWERLGR